MSERTFIYVEGGPKRGFWFKSAHDRDMVLASRSLQGLLPDSDRAFAGIGTAVPLHVATPEEWQRLQVGCALKPLSIAALGKDQ